MNITLKLLYGVAIVKNKGAIPITNAPLRVMLESNELIENLFITATNANKVFTIEVIDGVAVLPDVLKAAGTLRMTIRQIINGEVLRTWQTEDILIRELEAEHEAIPQITALTEKVTALTAAVSELKNLIIEREEF